jgi:hypothetical protein
MTGHRLLTLASITCGAAFVVPHPHASPRFTTWSSPVNLGAPVNSPFAETGARLSKHGLSLYFSSNRPCGDGDQVLDFNLWVSSRRSLDDAWGEPQCLAINVDAQVPGETPYQDREPELSRDGHWLFFVSDRPGSRGPLISAGGGDIWVSWRPHVFDDHGWTEPVNLIGINTDGAERTPHYFENDGDGFPQLFFASSRVGTDSPARCVTEPVPACIDIWVVALAEGDTIGAPARVGEVSSDDLIDAGGSVTHDGKEMFLFRGSPPDGIALDLYVATRQSLLAPWSAPVALGAVVNSAANDQEVTIASGRDQLFFASARAGGLGGLDIWVSSRGKERGRP